MNRIDAMLTPVTMPGLSNNALAVSPVLFPQRDAEPKPVDTSTPSSSSHGASSGSKTPLAEVPPLDLQSEGSRKVTRREKRERKARKDALRTALLTGQSLSSIHAASRAGSPTEIATAPGTPTGLEAPPQIAIQTASPRPATTESAPDVMRRPSSPTPLSKQRPSPTELGAAGSQISAGPAEGFPGLAVNTTNVAAEPSGEGSLPPSSAVRAPLYSPLFGGIAPPSGLTDDFEEDKSEPLMI